MRIALRAVVQFPEDLANSSVLGKMFPFSGKAWSEYGRVKKDHIACQSFQGEVGK